MLFLYNYFSLVSKQLKWFINSLISLERIIFTKSNFLFMHFSSRNLHLKFLILIRGSFELFSFFPFVSGFICDKNLLDCRNFSNPTQTVLLILHSFDWKMLLCIRILYFLLLFWSILFIRTITRFVRFRPSFFQTIMCNHPFGDFSITFSTVNQRFDDTFPQNI